MGPALRELMKDELNDSLNKGREAGVKSTVWACKKASLSFADAVESVIYGMDISQPDAEALVKKYW